MELPHFVELNNLASDRVGGKILFATDDWFAVAENLLKPEEPVFKEEDFTDFGKWMDGWETRRKRIPGHDWCIIKLGIPGLIYGFDVDTAFFTGNYAPRVSVQAACLDSDDGFPERKSEMGSAASTEQMDAMKKLKTEEWEEIVQMTEMGSGKLDACHNILPVAQCKKRWTHLRLNIYPDGGVARLRVYGVASPDWKKISPNELLDLVAMENGGVCVGYSNIHYGHARNLLSKPRSKVMKDGWETARRLDRPAILEADDNGVLQVDGSEWCVFRLGHPGTIKEIEVDTNHFKGNFPDSCTIEGVVLKTQKQRRVSVHRMSAMDSGFTDLQWKTILPTTKLSAHKQHFYKKDDVKDIGVVSHVRLTIRPDGGVSRLRLWGHKSSGISIPKNIDENEAEP